MDKAAAYQKESVGLTPLSGHMIASSTSNLVIRKHWSAEGRVLINKGDHEA